MPLTTALYTGLSGLGTAQTTLDVIGNNIANVNTMGFKSSRAMIETQFSETYGFGSPPTELFGGQNPTQKGLGSRVGGIQRDFSNGNIQTTGNNSDLALQGGGMFIVDGSERYFTRNGAFQLNSQNKLVTQQGYHVMGYGVDRNFNVVEGQLQQLTIPLGLMTTAKATSEVKFGGTLQSDGELATSASVLESQDFTEAGGGVIDASTLLTDLRDAGSQTFTAGMSIDFEGTRGGRVQGPRSLDVTATTTVGDLMDFMVNAFGVNTDASLSPAPGWQINDNGGGDYSFEITGNVGEDNALSVGSNGMDPLVLQFQTNAEANGESMFTSLTTYDSLGNSIELNVTMVFESMNDESRTWRYFANSPGDTDQSTVIGMGTVTFDTSGTYLSSTDTNVVIDRENLGVLTPLSIELDFENVQGMTVLSSQLTATHQDGFAAGTLNDYSVANDGTIIGTFNNGMTRTLGQVAVATFSNYEGLIDYGGNVYGTGPNSGEPVIGYAQLSGAGTIIGGALETSNVDISSEFINMIVASTGFQAASRVITTSNQLLTELFSIIR